LPQLIGKNLFEIWNIVNPMGLLSSLLSTQGRAPPEPRWVVENRSKCIFN
jgi:large subunit ribosomal protein L44